MKPTLRIIHNLARTGGTIMCRCLGCMEGVALLSEIHPDMDMVFDPITQARAWHGIHNTRETEFSNVIKEIEFWANEQGNALVVRSWDHIDFMPSKFNREPTYKSKLVEVLEPHFDLRRIAITRNGRDMWASLARHDSMAEDVASGVFTPKEFMRGYDAYLEATAGLKRFDYDSFLKCTTADLREMCSALELPYDDTWRDKWRAYHKVTGCLSNVKTLQGEMP